MSGNDTGSFSGGQPTPSSGSVNVGNSGWQAGDFQNGLGLLGMVPPGRRRVSRDGDQQAFSSTTQSTGASPWSDVALTKKQCLDMCSRLALPTGNFGVAFQRCMNQCRGRASYPEWEGRVG